MQTVYSTAPDDLAKIWIVLTLKLYFLRQKWIHRIDVRVESCVLLCIPKTERNELIFNLTSNTTFRLTVYRMGLYCQALKNIMWHLQLLKSAEKAWKTHIYTLIADAMRKHGNFCATNSKILPSFVCSLFTLKTKYCIKVQNIRSPMGVEHSGEGIDGCRSHNAKLFERIEHSGIR